MNLTHRRKIAQFTRKLLKKKPIFFDAETNGMDERAEVVQVAAIDHKGSVLLDSLIQPQAPIPFRATEVHGIDNDMVRDALLLPELWPDIESLLMSHVVVIFNSSFILRVLAQSVRQYNIFPRKPPEVYCAMLLYAEFYGQWDDIREAWVWQRLDEAVQQMELDLTEGMRLHRALDDCQVTRALLEKMRKFR